MTETSKAMRKKLSEEEIDKVIVAQADDDSAWERPIQVRRNRDQPNVQLNIPIYLEPEVGEFMRALAEKKGIEVEKIVNDWLRKDIDLVQSAQ